MKYSIKINTTQDFLDSIELTLKEVQNEVNSFIQLIGKKYFKIFSSEINSNDISRILYYKSILEPISNCTGFKRHVKEYNNTELESHLFTAKVASYLLKKGYEVELEPPMETKDSPHPDLRFMNENHIGYAECKTSDISRFYDTEKRKQIADIVFKNIPTCDQIDLYFTGKMELNEIESTLTDKRVIQSIHMFYRRGKEKQENRIKLNEGFSIGVIQQPLIIGAPEDFSEITMSVILEDNLTGLRMIGNVFNKGGQSVSVFNVIDYTNKLKSKKEQSSKQVINGYPNIVFLRDSDILGNPENHQAYINSEWFNERHEYLSGVAFYETYKHSSKEIKDKLRYYQNPNAKYKVELIN